MTPRTAPGAARPVTPASILAARLESLVGRAGGTGLEDELREVRDLAVGLDPYVESMTSPESPALADLAAATAAFDWRDASGSLEQEMLSGHVEGRFLAMLAHATRARRVLEVGMFTGYSALALAEALPDDGSVVALELDESVAAFAQEQFARSSAGRRIDVRVGPAAETLRALAGESFDLVFVDADKAGYADYLETVLTTGLLAPGGLVCVDNTLMQGQPWAGPDTENGRAIAEFNAAVAADPRVEQVVVPLRDGITLIRAVS
ncbi:O-methyltransferase [Actinomycetospora termitidis]|uniref:Class I SAM-dependent methyltransferase n=1 Tax=Actinomycetospora termitidis TaxID=3053470 RepID=A0ABT7M6U2_9PSEU|nr:class I SAM-dependent methyltransferase [Actinomycetospora sp. Odt1-22]MDL5156400.1 class I SAM-dependent methyltransferase [Actinomycetospora sp. Odt1-22]